MSESKRQGEVKKERGRGCKRERERERERVEGWKKEGGMEESERE